ncbi:MAG: hypothetical protein K6G73_01120 [Marinilabiliaceae bacterium]|nr:hypothetical protein [Marinilabiliaceae bacterium]
MNSIVHLVRKYSQIRVLTVVIIIAICSIITACHAKPRQYKFVPYKGKVVSCKTDKTMHGGVYYQRIELDNKEEIAANAFSSIIAGQKTMLINYIAVGDSIVRNTFDTIYVYREGADTYVFTHNKGDFK